MASEFVTIAVKNSSGVVINAVVKAVNDNTGINLDQGNYGADNQKVFQLPATATGITLIIKYEKFIDIWHTVYDQQQPDTEQWQTSNMGFTVSGPDGKVKVSGPSWG